MSMRNKSGNPKMSIRNKFGIKNVRFSVNLSTTNGALGTNRGTQKWALGTNRGTQFWAFGTKKYKNNKNIFLDEILYNLHNHSWLQLCYSFILQKNNKNYFLVYQVGFYYWFFVKLTITWHTLLIAVFLSVTPLSGTGY